MVDFYKKRCYNIKADSGERTPNSVATDQALNKNQYRGKLKLGERAPNSVAPTSLKQKPIWGQAKVGRERTKQCGADQPQTKTNMGAS